ncbi:MAG: curli assembly protein CsgG [Telluria sp.]
MQGERELMKSGELRQASKFGKGMMVAADYTATPSVSFSAQGTGGLGGLVGGRIGVVASLIGGSMKSNEASAMLLLTDNRSGIQLAAAEGSAKNWDFGVIGGLFNGGGAVGGGYTRTPEGKVLAAAFMDSYNQMVKAVRNYKAQSVEGGLGTGGVLKTN